MKEINLFRSLEKRPLKGLKITRQKWIGLIIFLIFYLLLTGAVFSYWFNLKNQKEVLLIKIKDQEKRLTYLEAQETLYVLIKQRLSHLQSWGPLANSNQASVLGYLKEKNQDGIFFDEIKILPDDEVVLEGEAADPYKLVDFLTVLTQDEKKLFKTAVLNSSERDEAGVCSFSLSLFSEESPQDEV